MTTFREVLLGEDYVFRGPGTGTIIDAGANMGIHWFDMRFAI
jgi:hypothetical protein